jgi:hypothetical protein
MGEQDRNQQQKPGQPQQQRQDQDEQRRMREQQQRQKREPQGQRDMNDPNRQPGQIDRDKQGQRE